MEDNPSQENKEELPINNDEGGLNTGLRPKNRTNEAPIASPEVELFFKDLTRTLLLKIDAIDEKEQFKKAPLKTKKLKTIMKDISNKDVVVVPTDKTNSYKVVTTDEYKNWVHEHLQKSAIVITKERLGEKYKEAGALLESLTETLSANEYGYLNETIKSKAIPTPKLLIKDHKDPDINGVYPTRLIVPATNFAAGFSNIGYRGIRSILDKHKINYSRYTIVQASDVKEKLERLNIKQNETTIVSIDAVNMYPSIQCKMVKKAIYYFLSTIEGEVDEKDTETIEKCLELITFGMGSTFLTFVDKYYEYDGNVDIKDRGLTIGGYESAWLADLVISYIFENTKQHFTDTIYNGCYRDDELGIFTGNRNLSDMADWLNKFQLSVNELLDSDKLQFTLAVWGADKQDIKDALFSIPRHGNVLEERQTKLQSPLKTKSETQIPQPRKHASLRLLHGNSKWCKQQTSKTYIS
jgi:hypothetical protein